MTRARVWALYASVWVPIALLYALVLGASPAATGYRMSVREALIAGLNYVVPIALLGVGVWWLTGIETWPPRAKARFVVVHVLAAVLLSALWLAVQVGSIAMGTSIAAALEISKRFAGYQLLDGLFVYGLLAAGSYVARIATRLREQEARAARADALRMRAELAALRGQLNPHFLFNTLHTLTALVRRDPETAEHALERFGDVLRYVLDVKRAAREDVTLADEVRFVHDYLSLEQLRLGDRLRVRETLDPDALDCVIPSLTLQPLVENAIKHAIAPRARGGTLEITAALDEDDLVLEVRDDGPGADASAVQGAIGMGLRAVRQRLETRYANGARFVVTTAPGTGFAVRISLPAHATSSAVAAPQPA